ncbi:STAS domain-containing protein [Litoribacter ruber]|uniref:Anti-sigma factor antagonist n=1 Tax=Litoribacter ruber TaxID=702568 RepID=A0AAP2CER8_9BACT|nr:MULTISPECIES: STAS domain-containing protein [Litoribacter]MBS9523171.1 STAS domain-containing protein [Litoribacter alkaliphilus]MBT0810666.1 STAS domain-containing protein [Litoribacter ruber]
MKYSVDKKEQYVVFTPHEEKLDSALSPVLKSELLTVHAEGYRNMILDMSEVKYADSSGLSALLVGNRAFNEDGGIFVISNPQEHVMKLIKISMLDKVLNVADSHEEAAEAIFIHEIKNTSDEEE